MTDGHHAPCVRSGHCCKVATCAAGVAHGQPMRNCGFLMGSGPGDYRCQLVEDNPHLAQVMAVGAGCSSTLFNRARDFVLRQAREV